MASFKDRSAGALWGVFVADALSMPVHWYYDLEALRRDFGTITKYEAPKEPHPNGFMHRAIGTAPTSALVGEVLLHGRKELWAAEGTHYHHGMQPGENTLNSLCCRVLIRSMAAEKTYSQPAFLKDYVAFVTFPGTHNDTYAESYHRDFFNNWSKGIAPESCAGAETSSTASIGGFVTLPPVVIQSASLGDDEFAGVIRSHLFLTHKSETLLKSALAYATLLRDVLKGADLRTAVQAAGEKIGVDVKQLVESAAKDADVVGGKFNVSCSIDNSLPSVLFFAYKYADNFEAGVLANTNAGGENCHRGSALGSILGAANGAHSIPEPLVKGLVASADIDKEITGFVAAFC